MVEELIGESGKANPAENYTDFWYTVKKVEK